MTREWQSLYSDAPYALGMHDDTLVVAESSGRPWTAANATGLSGFTVDGEELWTDFPEIGSYVGDDGSGAVVLTHGIAGDLHRERGVPVTRHNWQDVRDYEVLGTVASRVRPIGLAGDLLLAEVDERLVALRLPETGETSDVDLTTTEEWVSPAVPEDAWAADDVRPGDLPLCTVSDRTLASLGFHRLDLPRPVGCVWLERQQPRNLDRELSVRTYVATPSEQAGLSAVEQARKELQRLRKDWRTESTDYSTSAPVRDLTGVGDEAVVVEAPGVGGRQGRVGVAVRVRNVVVSAQMTAGVSSSEAAGMVAPHTYEAGVWAAVSESLEAAGLTVAAPEMTTRRTRALRRGTDLCAALAGQVGWMLPGVDGRGQAPDGGKRAAGCVWRERPVDHDSAQVGIVAVPDSTLTGGRGAALAAIGQAAVRRAQRWDSDFSEYRVRRVPGLGDEAWVNVHHTWMHRSARSSTDWLAAIVNVRRGNLTVAVQLQLKGVDGDALQERAITLARAALATQDVSGS